MKHQGIREIIRIVEYKDDCVWKTKSEGLAWVTFDTKPTDKNIQYSSVSFKTLDKLNTSGVRTVSDDTPDVVKL